ncbi:MAG: hypothetical protein ABIS35_12760, partial [Terracoccus sp.]
MAAAYVNSVVLQAPSYLLAGPPDGLLDIPARPDLVEAGHLAQRLVGIVVAAAAVDLARCLLALAPDAPTLPAVPEDGVVEVDLDGRRVA